MNLRDIIVGLGRLPWAGRVERFADTFCARLGAKTLTRVHAGPIDTAIAARHDVLVREGPAAAVLQDEGEARHADFVIVGSGATGTRPDLGATTRQMLRTITLPLLVVPTHLPEDWEMLIDCVLAPCDLTGRGERALLSAHALAMRLGSPLHLVHVETRPKPDRLAAVNAALTARAERLGAKNITAEVVCSPNVGEGIAARAAARNAIVALPSHGKGENASFIVGATTERIVGASAVPVLVFPP